MLSIILNARSKKHIYYIKARNRMKISIDTREEREEDIRALIRFLQSFISDESPAEKKNPAQSQDEEKGDTGDDAFSAMRFLSEGEETKEKEEDNGESENQDDDAPSIIPY